MADTTGRGDMAEGTSAPSGDTIYGLVDPRKPHIIRYVGWTVEPERRLGAHTYSAKNVKHPSYKTYRSAWIRKLLREGVRPRMVILEEHPPEGWAAAELAWIRALRLLGFPLTNMCDGGQGRKGYKLSAAARLAISTKKMGRPQSPEVVARRNATRAARRATLGPSDAELAAQRRFSTAGVLAHDTASFRKQRVALIGEAAVARLEDRAWLVERYVVERASARAIAADVGVSKRAVLLTLHRHGIAVRDAQDPAGRTEPAPVPCPECDMKMAARALPGHIRGHENCRSKGHEREPGPKGGCRVCFRESTRRIRAALKQ